MNRASFDAKSELECGGVKAVRIGRLAEVANHGECPCCVKKYISSPSVASSLWPYSS